MKLRFPIILIALVAAIGLSACAPTVAKRGNMVDEERLKEITPGVTTREGVANILGTPTQTSTFDDKIWYYIGRTTEQTSFLAPEVKEQKIVAVQFTPEGIVQKISKGGLKYAEDVEPNSDKTPTYGREVSLVQQLLGNLGRPGIGSRGKSGPK
jgi:outer membrane protein assembly factor BamE (lipoprotein component of BamABCDE complex)